MLEKMGGLKKGCFRKVGEVREGVCYKRGADNRRGVF